MRKYLALVVII